LKLTRLIFVTILLTLIFTSGTIAQDQPTIMKDWVAFDAFTVNHQKGNYDVWTWLPRTEFRVNGPIPSGGQLYVEVGYPGTMKWVTYDCDTSETQKGYWWKVRCGGRDNIDEAKGVTYTGPVNFTIKMRNELQGSDMILFNGKAKVAKVHSGEAGPKYVNRMVYYVDQDAFLPIGYVWMIPDSIHGWKRTTPNVAFWVRGEAYKMKPHMFYQGKEIGRQMLDGIEVGAASCDTEIELNPSISTKSDFPQGAKWRRVVCKFHNIMGRDESGQSYGAFQPPFLMGKNPGEYEFKLLWNNKLARSIKFTVKPGGSFDNGIATSNKLGDDRVIFPVTIIGDQDGIWDKNSWKTDAFYGNPLTGFTVGP
jgi:hypothetical protein